MTRDEWCAYAESTPATPPQVGTVITELERLGVVDRAERLAVCGALLGLENLGSTRDLTLGQAGYLVNLLQRTRARAELPGITAADDDGDQAGEHDGRNGSERITWPEAIARIMTMIYTANWGKGITDD